MKASSYVRYHPDPLCPRRSQQCSMDEWVTSFPPILRVESPPPCNPLLTLERACHHVVLHLRKVDPLKVLGLQFGRHLARRDGKRRALRASAYELRTTG
eukprot:scaffold577_cov405-Prasinococcus_capsulatus_cf.AAC.10